MSKSRMIARITSIVIRLCQGWKDNPPGQIRQVQRPAAALTGEDEIIILPSFADGTSACSFRNPHRRCINNMGYRLDLRLESRLVGNRKIGCTNVRAEEMHYNSAVVTDRRLAPQHRQKIVDVCSTNKCEVGCPRGQLFC